jgi:hypothetical protein
LLTHRIVAWNSSSSERQEEAVGKSHKSAAHGGPKRRHDGPFFISGHAFDQFRERICPQLSPGRARVECMIISRTAERTQGRTGTGDEIWCATDGAPIRFVVRDDAGARICLTVLAPEDVA